MDKNSKEALYVRRLARGEIKRTYGTHGTYVTKNMSRKSHTSRNEPVTFENFRAFFETRPPEVLANIIICLIHQTNYLLDQQIRRLEEDFVEKGGLRESMTRARLAHRNRK